MADKIVLNEATLLFEAIKDGCVIDSIPLDSPTDEIVTWIETMCEDYRYLQEFN